jgi:outer membrane protein TolC
VEESALISSAFAKGNIEEAWQEIFNDPQLNFIIEDVLQTSPTLKKAEARVLTAQAKAREVRSSLFPSLYANAEEIERKEAKVILSNSL